MKSFRSLFIYSKTTYFVFIGALLSVFFIHGCHVSKGKKSLVVIKSAVKAPQGIAFLDVNDAIPHNVRNVKITLIDPGEMVLSSNGIPIKSLVLTGGIMSVGLSPKATFSAERPYRFTIRAEAEGYMTNIRSILITENTPNYIPIYLVKLDAAGLPPSGLAASFGQLTSVSGGVFTRDQTLQARLPQSNFEPLIIKIREGTRLLNNGKPIESKDSLSFRLVFGIPGDTNANSAFPGGFEVSDAIDQKGKNVATPANPIFFTTAGWFSMEMKLGNSAVNGFSRPVEVEIPIADTVFNPETRKPLQAGDKIPFWALDYQTGRWRLESTTEIVGQRGGLKARVTINHLSSFNLDIWTGTTCTISVPFNATPTSDFPGSYFTEFYNTANNSLIRSKIVNYTINNAGTSSPTPLEVLRVPVGTTGKLYVHDGTDVYAPLRGISADLVCGVPCSTSPCLGRLGSGAFPGITIKFEKQTASGTVPDCSNTVWHKPSPSATYWTHVGNLNSLGTLLIPLSNGVIQQLQLWYASTTPGQMVSLTFEMNFTVGSGGTSQGWINDNSMNTFNFTYSVTAGTPNLITVTIDEAVITGNNISCI